MLFIFAQILIYAGSIFGIDTLLCEVEKVQEVIKTKTIARPRTWLDYNHTI